MIGTRIGRLVLISEDTSREKTWNCLCDCGNWISVPENRLKSKPRRSCGCLQKEEARRIALSRSTHGMSHSSTYSSWRAMIKRCEYPLTHDYCRYGGSGITVCDRWHSFSNFLEDMGPRPDDKPTIDRIDSRLGYFKENCRWASWKTQENNRPTVVRMLTLYGKTQCLTDWAKEYHINKGTIVQRLNKGMSVEEAITTPPRKYPPK